MTISRENEKSWINNESNYSSTVIGVVFETNFNDCKNIEKSSNW
jgi:hypothetical protein